MRQTAKPHPTDARDQAWIAEAIYFTAFCQRGPRDRRREQVDVTDTCSRDMAMAGAKAKAQQLANTMGKAALVYAVTAAGRSAHVTSIYPEAVGGPTTMKTATPTPTAYASKSAATKAARAALGADARFTTDKGPLGWTFAAMPDTDPVEDTMAQLDAAEAASAIFADADADATAADALAARPADLVQARDIGGHVVMVCPNDPLLVDGVKYPSKARASEARRLAADRAKRPAKAAAKPPKAAKPGPVQKAAAKAAPAVKKAVAAAVAKAAAPAAGKRAQVLADAQRGIVPAAPDFSAETHKRYRAQLTKVQAMAAAGDVKGLKAEEIKTSGSSGKALDRFRQLAIVAIESGK